MSTELLNPDSIIIPEFVQRSPAKVADDFLRKSIEKHGIQQVCVVVDDRSGGRILADGLRRLRIAKLEGIKLPVIVVSAPAGGDPTEHARQLRIILQHEQDLSPSQKADLIVKLKEMFGMTHTQVAAYLGIAQDSVTNWLAVRQYIEPVRQAVDSGIVSLHAARTFDGLTEEGQRKIWKKHSDELMTQRGDAIHKRLRQTYSPDSHPTFYRQPDLIKARLKGKGGARKGKARPTVTAAEKQRLSTSFELKEAELQEWQEEEQRMKDEIAAATAPIYAIKRNPKLWGMLTEEMQAEFERFTEIY